MKNDRSLNEIGLEKMGVFKLLLNMDTQSAVVAAVLISIGTVLVNYMMELCTFVYWGAYFSRFNIPLEYFDEAIISETGVKYTVVLCIPVVIFVWWCLNGVCNVLEKLFVRIRFSKVKNNEKKRTFFDNKKWYVKCIKIMLIVFVFGVYLLSCVGLLQLYFELEYYRYGVIVFFLCVEVVYFVLSKICKKYFGNFFGFSKTNYYGVRIIGGAFAIYLLLGGVFFAGSFSNTGVFRGEQVVSIVNETDDIFFDIKEFDKVKMVLFETKDYYYITDAEVDTDNGPIRLAVWNDDSYKFIDKVGCSIKKEYINLFYMSKSYDEDMHNNIFGIYLCCVSIFIFVFRVLLSIPVKMEKEGK